MVSVLTRCKWKVEHTHIRSKDVSIATMEDLSLEVRGKRSNPRIIVLKSDVSVGRESARLKSSW